MLDIRSLGHINIVVPDIDEAEKYYSEVFGAKTIATLKNFKNEGMATNMGLENVDVSEKILKLPRCNLVLGLSQFHSPQGNQNIQKVNINDMSNTGHIGLHVDNIEASFDFLKSRNDVEILNKDNFRPVTYSPISKDQFQLDEQVEKNTTEKERLAQLLSNKKSFYFRDKYGVIWQLEERFYQE